MLVFIIRLHKRYIVDSDEDYDTLEARMQQESNSAPRPPMPRVEPAQLAVESAEEFAAVPPVGLLDEPPVATKEDLEAS